MGPNTAFRMPPLMLNDEEAFAVALGLSALQHVGLNALAPAVAGVETKLARVVPTAVWSRTLTLSAALQLEKPPWAEAVDAALITELAAATAARQQLELRYENYRRVRSVRTVQPLGLVRDGGLWFLAAYCLDRQDKRLFRIDRIAAAQKTQVGFEPPEGFDVRAFLEQRLQNVPARWQVEVWLGATFETLRYDLVLARASVAEEDGGVVLRCGVNDLEGFAARLLEFGCPFELRSPPELKTAFRKVAERAASFAAG